MPCVAENETLLRQIVAQSFQQRRKTLRNCLRSYLEHLEPETGEGTVVDLTRRPEQLSVAEFVALSNHINQSINKGSK